MNRKRRVPAAVTKALERKRHLASTFAQRQSAALGKDARQQLKPLIEAGGITEFGVEPISPPELTFSFRIDTAQWMQQMSQPLVWKPSPTLMPNFGSVTLELPKLKPSINADKLDALKAAIPYKPKPEMRVPDMVQCITGWRGWALSKHGRLEALGQNTIWPAKEALTAVCEGSGNHRAPEWSCSCGIWAFKDVDRLVAAIGARYSGVKVIGSVSLWGKVIETENGYRAENAYPAELWLLDPSLEELGLIYDVPVRRVQPSTECI